MTKVADPTTFSGCVARVLGALTAPEAAKASGRAPRTVYGWADEDQESLPRIDEALRLDAAYVNAGLGKPPLLDLYARELAQATAGAEAETGDPVGELLDVLAADGRIAEAFRKATDPKSTGGRDLTPAEVRVLLNASRDVRTQLDEFERAVKKQVSGKATR